LDKSFLYEGVRQRADFNRSSGYAYDRKGFPTREAAIELQRQMKVDAIIMVNVTHLDTWVHRRPVRVSYGFYRGGPHSHMGMHFHDRDDFIGGGILGVLYRMVADGQIISEPIIPVQRFSDRSSWRISEDHILNALAEAANRDFIRYIDVVTVRRARVLKEGDVPETEAGVNAALKKNWLRAEELWLKATEIYPDNYAAYYDLGVAAEVRQNFKEAEEFYIRAREITEAGRVFENEIKQAHASAKACEMIDRAKARKNRKKMSGKSSSVQEKVETTIKTETVGTPDKNNKNKQNDNAADPVESGENNPSKKEPKTDDTPDPDRKRSTL